MDAERDPLIDVDEDIRRALSVQPSADFVNRTRAHVRASAAPATPWPTLTLAAAAVVAAAVWMMPARTSSARALASSAWSGIGQLAPVFQGSPVADALTEESSDIATRRPEVGPLRPAVGRPLRTQAPEVIVAASERRGLRLLLSALEDHRINVTTVDSDRSSVSEPIELNALAEPAPIQVLPLSASHD